MGLAALTNKDYCVLVKGVSMEKITKEIQRRKAREYIMRINDYYLEEQALHSQLELLQKRMGPAGLPKSSLGDSVGGGGEVGIMEQFHQLTELKSSIFDLKEKAVECELDVMRCIFNISDPKYRAVLTERYINRRDIYAISLIYKSLGMPNNSINYIKRLLRRAEEAFYEKNLK